jgi:hypothetical protein
MCARTAAYRFNRKPFEFWAGVHLQVEIFKSFVARLKALQMIVDITLIGTVHVISAGN